jgi:hypothetical protein
VIFRVRQGSVVRHGPRLDPADVSQRRETLLDTRIGNVVSSSLGWRILHRSDPGKSCPHDGGDRGAIVDDVPLFEWILFQVVQLGFRRLDELVAAGPKRAKRAPSEMTGVE